MSENILSLEDLKLLEELHQKYGMQFLRCDDNGILMNAGVSAPDRMNSLMEVTKKLKTRLNSNFQLNFSNGLNFDVVRV